MLPNIYVRLVIAVLVTSACLFGADTSLAKKKPPAHPVNLNTASAAELEQVPGIGPSTAQKILETRKSYGSFKSVDDLRAVRGIGPKRLEQMRRYLTVGKTSPPKKTPQTAQGLTSSTPAKPPPGKKAKDKSVSPKKTPPDQADDEEEP